MCQPSKMDQDWVTKGFHLSLDGVEIAVRPTHSPTYLDGFKFVKFFSKRDDEFTGAAKRAREECLSDPIVRARWRRDLERGIEHMRSFSRTAHAKQANGRQFEFRWLIRHLDAFGERHGNA